MARRDSQLLQWLTYLKRGPRLSGGHLEENPRKRRWEELYRHRWEHDKVTRSTHGVNCTGSCSWKIHTKDGIITWETQQVDYPSMGPDFPDHEPRGCPRGASTSWYEYSPVRIRYPYMRGALLELWRNAKRQTDDPVAAWAAIAGSPESRRAYQSQRGRGGFVRVTWDEVVELIAAAAIHTIRQYGPDRIAGFSPIPAMSMVSYTAGARFLSLIGGAVLSFYDWYADLPIASPQIWGEQTDVPESGDWYNCRYMIIWGTNLPMTRTPDAHFMVEARYRGLKVVGVAPDYSEYIKFCDTWLPARPGTDGALAMAMTHVILKEFYVDNPNEYFISYVKKYTDLPFLVRLTQKGESYQAAGFVTMADLGYSGNAMAWKPVLWDASANSPAGPNGTMGFRWDGSGRWNLKLEDEGRQLSPQLSFLGHSDATAPVDFPYFGTGKGESLRRHVPVKKLPLGGETAYVTTVFDLMLANAGVGRGLEGAYPKNYDDPAPYTPAWQEAMTGVDRAQAIKVAREFAETASRTKGRAMILMGAGTNHWYHSDMLYRAMINLVLLCGCEGVNGGGWAHYVGQEKVRPIEGLGTVGFAADWVPISRLQNTTSYFYFHTGQYRYDEQDLEMLSWPGGGKFSQMHPADVNAMAVRLGWLPFAPQFLESPLETARKARASGATTEAEIANQVARRLASGDLELAVDNPEDPRSFPRMLMIWRSNLLTSTGKGHEYFLRHLLGTDGHILQDPQSRPKSIKTEVQPPSGKLDLFIDSDFRMTDTALFSDILLPAATWYEKHDISTTDMHPFIHPFMPAISPPWETKTDWSTFLMIADVFSRLAKGHLPAQEDLVMGPIPHDTPFELAQEGGKVRDWRRQEAEPVPGKSMPRFVPVKRDYPNVYSQMVALGPRAEQAVLSKGIPQPSEEAYKELLHSSGKSDVEGPGKNRPSLREDYQVANAIMALSGATNGHRAVMSWKTLEKYTGLKLEHVAKGFEQEVMTIRDLSVQPRLCLPTAAWSGLKDHERRYSPFTANVELEIPFRTLTGRQHFYLDHEMMLDFGEAMPLYRPPLERTPFPKGAVPPDFGDKYVILRYLTPHQKWGIHTTFADTWPMLALFRGGPVIWMSQEDAEQIGVKDNGWVEVFNRNGAVATRAVVTHRIPKGICMYYHGQTRHIGIPGTTITGDRGGPHNSLQRVIPKPTHMIGGYGHLSYGYNYYGPTGHNRDEVVVIRPLKEVNWLES